MSPSGSSLPASPGTTRGFALRDVAATIEDLESKNGTYLRGERLAAPSPLTDGDELRLGSVPAQIPPAGDHQFDPDPPQSVVGSRQSAVGSRQSAVGSRQSAVGSRQSAVGSPQNKPGKIQQLPQDFAASASA